MDADHSFRSLFMISLRGAFGGNFTVNDLQDGDTPALLTPGRTPLEPSARERTHTRRHTYTRTRSITMGVLILYN